jgi:hypothetical protein
LVVSDTSLLLAVTRSGFGTSALLAKATFCSAGVASNFHATEIADTSKEKILRAYLRRLQGRSGGSSRASTPMPCAAESLRTTPPDLYAQILMTAEGEAAEAARKDPDAFVALFLSYADEQEVIAGSDVPTKKTVAAFGSPGPPPRHDDLSAQDASGVAAEAPRRRGSRRNLVLLLLTLRSSLVSPSVRH